MTHSHSQRTRPKEKLFSQSTFIVENGGKTIQLLTPDDVAIAVDESNIETVLATALVADGVDDFVGVGGESEPDVLKLEGLYNVQDLLSDETD